MENYQKNYTNTDRSRSVTNPPKLKSNILPQSDLVVDNSSDLDIIVNVADDNPKILTDLKFYLIETWICQSVMILVMMID